MTTEGESGKSSIPGASLNLINSIAGAAIVAIPHAIQQCGLFLGLFLLIFLAYSMHHIITALMDCALRAGELNLEDLTGRYFGPRGRTVTLVVMLLYTLGSMVACMVVVGDTLPPAISDLFGYYRVRTKDEIVIIVAVLVVLPLSLVRDVSSLAFASGMAFIAIFVLVLGVLTQGPAESHAQGLTFTASEITIVNRHLFRGIGVLSFHYVCQHPCLEDVKQVSRLSMGAVLFLSLVLGLGGYLIFGDTIDGNVLNNYSTKATAISLARMCMAINMIFTYPMELFVARHACFALLSKLLFSDSDRLGDRYDLADTLSQHSVGSSVSSMRSVNLDNVSSGDSEHSNDSRDCHGCEQNTEADDFVMLGQWKDIGIRSRLGISSGPPCAESVLHDRNDSTNVAPPLALHFLMTVILWSFSLAIAIGFNDVSLVLSLSGIVAASCLGYIIPVAIYLKTHEDEVRSKFSRSRIPGIAYFCFGGSDEWGSATKIENSANQKDLDNNIIFFIALGVFGVCSLVVGLCLEVLSVFGVAKEIDPTVNY